METPGGIGSRDDSGGVLPSLPGSSGQKHLQVLDQTSEGDVFSNEQPQLPVDTQETSWHPVKIPEASDFTEVTNSKMLKNLLIPCLGCSHLVLRC